MNALVPVQQSNAEAYRASTDAAREGHVPDALHHSREEARLRSKAAEWRRVARTAFDNLTDTMKAA